MHLFSFWKATYVDFCKVLLNSFIIGATSTYQPTKSNPRNTLGRFSAWKVSPDWNRILTSPCEMFSFPGKVFMSIQGFLAHVWFSCPWYVCPAMKLLSGFVARERFSCPGKDSLPGKGFPVIDRFASQGKITLPGKGFLVGKGKLSLFRNHNIPDRDKMTGKRFASRERFTWLG